MQRQSLVEYGKSLQATEAPTPAPQGTEVLVRVTHCGVCHSDIHLQDGYFDLGRGQQLDVRAGRTLPFTLGHEIAGVVEATGPDAAGVPIGKFFAVYPWIGCGQCAICTRGDEHLCAAAPRALGITVDGGYATHVLAPHPRYLMDAEGLAPQVAAAFMCSGLTAYSALKKAKPFLRAGPLMIVGLGGVGMMGLQFARAMIDGPIFVADIDEAKRKAALGLGAQAAFDPADPDARKAIGKATGGVGAAVDFAGSDKSLDFAQALVAKGGAVILVGLIGGAFSMPAPMFPLRALTIMGSMVGSLAEAGEMLALAKGGKVATIPMELRPLAEAGRALDDLRAGRVVGRVVITP